MHSEQDAIADISSDEAILVEYLDGELSVDERRIVEERLAKEPEFRSTLARLEESWQFLDLLEREDTDKELVETTLEVLVLEEEKTVIFRKSRFPWKNLLRTLSFLLLFAFAFASGERIGDKHFFLRVASPIIERLDMYSPLLDEDPDLLRLLTERRLFLPPRPSDSRPVDPKEYAPSPSGNVLESYTMRPSFEELDRRVRRIESFDDALYARFYSNYQKFLDLSWKKKHALRDLHESIERSPGRAELFQTLQNFHNWRKSLQSYEKAELRRPLPAAERVEQIAELKRHFDAHRSDFDTEPVIDDLVEDNKGDRLTKALAEYPKSDLEYLLNEPPGRILRVLTHRADAKKD